MGDDGGWVFGLSGFRLEWVCSPIRVSDDNDDGWVCSPIGIVMMTLVGSERERGAMSEKIIKNCKRMNILLNKCVE